MAKVRAIKMALEIVALRKLILNRYQHGFLVGTDNTDNKTTQICYPYNSLEVKLDVFSKICHRLVCIGRIIGLGDATFGKGFPLQATLPELKLGGSEYVSVLICKIAAFFLEIGQHVDKIVLRYQHFLVWDHIIMPFFGSCTTSIACCFPANMDGIGLVGCQR